MVTLEEYIVTMMMTPIIDPLNPRSLYEPTTLWGVTTCFVGLSGIAKTQRISNSGKLVDLPVFGCSAATKQPEEFGGAFVPTANGILIECVLPAARKAIDKVASIIHVDELSCARPAVQSAFLSMCDERRVGDIPLPAKTRIIVTMNPPEYAAGGYALEPPMANKMAHYAYHTPSVRDYIRYRMGIAPKNPIAKIDNAEKHVLDNFYKHWPRINGLFNGFFEKMPDVIQQQPKPGTPDSGDAWPSLRTWHWASCAVTTARCLGMPEELDIEIVQSLVGEGAATAWHEYTVEANLPDPAEVLKNGWKPDKKRLDITLAAVSSISDYVAHHEDYKTAVKLAIPAWKIFDAVIDSGATDMIIDPMTLFIRAKLGRKHHGNADLAAAADKVIGRLSNKKEWAEIING